MKRFATYVASTRTALQEQLSDGPASEVLRKYLVRGKMLRAYLVFAASAAVGGDPANGAAPAQAIELLHAASLFHDDVIDEAPQRRGMPSLHAQLGIGPALVLGDELLLRALGVLAETRDRHSSDRVLRAMEELIRCARDCCHGQYRELNASPWIDEREYFAIISGKTGAPFVAAGILGAMFGGGTETQIACIRSYAGNLGIAFQIADDILDLIGEPEGLGKPVGNSLAHERPLLPLLHLWQTSTDAVRAQLRDIRERQWPRREVVQLIESHGAFDAVRKVLVNYVHEAVSSLDDLAGASGVEALRELATGVAAFGLNGEATTRMS